MEKGDKNKIVHPDIHYPAKAAEEAHRENQAAQKAREKEEAETQRLLRLYLQEKEKEARARLEEEIRKRIPNLEEALKGAR